MQLSCNGRKTDSASRTKVPLCLENQAEQRKYRTALSSHRNTQKTYQCVACSVYDFTVQFECNQSVVKGRDVRKGVFVLPFCVVKQQQQNSNTHIFARRARKHTGQLGGGWGGGGLHDECSLACFAGLGGLARMSQLHMTAEISVCRLCTASVS